MNQVIVLETPAFDPESSRYKALCNSTSVKNGIIILSVLQFCILIYNLVSFSISGNVGLLVLGILVLGAVVLTVVFTVNVANILF